MGISASQSPAEEPDYFAGEVEKAHQPYQVSRIARIEGKETLWIEVEGADLPGGKLRFLTSRSDLVSLQPGNTIYIQFMSERAKADGARGIKDILLYPSV